MPPKKNKPAQTSAAPLSKEKQAEIDEVKKRFKRNMVELCPVLESVMEDLDEYQSIVASELMDSDTFKNEVALQKSVVRKMEDALQALQDAAALTHLVDGGNEDGARKKKKTTD